MNVDPITTEVLSNRFDVIANEMEVALLRASYSPVVKEALDASSALFTPQGDVIAQASSIPIHLGCLLPAVRRIIECFPVAEMAEGDAYIMNDPYDGGTHLPDTTVVQPVHCDGAVVALCATMTHNQDLGGATPGSLPTDATEIFQEGLCIPPLKFLIGGAPNQTLHALLRKNVRLPDTLIGDLYGQIAAGTVGSRRFQEVVGEYGANVVGAAIHDMMNQTEAATRAVIAAIPDGEYVFSDYLDNDGVERDRLIRIRVRMKVSGSDIHFDFDGTDGQTRGPINCVPSSTASGVFCAVRMIAGPGIGNNSGCYRPISLTMPPASVVNPNYPAAVNARVVTTIRIADAIQGALAQALPDAIPAAHGGPLTGTFGAIDPKTSISVITNELGTGGVGARPGRDGIDALEFGPVNCMNIPVEAHELGGILRIVRSRLRCDSGGAGRFRGGLGTEKTFEAVRLDVRISLRGERFYSRPWGVRGGHAGEPARAFIETRDGERREVPSKLVFTLRAGDRLHIFTAGGGGYGDPLDRDPEAVAGDVLDRKVSAEAAREIYGVVLAPGGMSVDRPGTLALRDRMRGAGPAATANFSHGGTTLSAQGMETAAIALAAHAGAG
ncbi:hydantoinase B/oxoprolinase family protein [Bosea sp. (in: a-proteobacteria)]|uniref:hydantoinase B/oxoprolinase family protein n=1 Tax=Bosea sp. (in: a-proteobacteria) TaxID=1871050 RepID=UPI00262031FD|nr:hydantoinase B/oxoprolinase family protein [Bosea sp. (in: a-proteobacteria)]MCO5089553.1 hydantoinase B/oxoprolinase family protein [Bosea sp. (in: a-proteobacteria)]